MLSTVPGLYKELPKVGSFNLFPLRSALTSIVPEHYRTPESTQDELDTTAVIRLNEAMPEQCRFEPKSPEGPNGPNGLYYAEDLEDRTQHPAVVPQEVLDIVAST
jgi:hypothetical protein